MLTFLRKKTKGIIIAVAVIFVATMFYGVISSRGVGGREQSRPSSSIAKVNGQELDSHRYREIMSRLINQLGQEIRPQDLSFVQNMALGQTVDFTLILAAAKKSVKVSNQEVKMALDGIIKQEKIPSEKELATALKQIGLTLPKFKQLVKDEIMVQKMVTKIKNEVTVGPNDLREIKASHILVTEEALAKELLAKLAKGASFAALAEQYSTDPGSKNKGGDLGYFSTGMMVAPFEKAAFALKVGEMSGVVQSSFGYHLITITDSRLRKFTGEEKDVEKAALAEKQAKVFRQWFSEIKEKAKVEIINPMLKAHDLRFKGRAFEAVQEYKKAIAQEPHNPYLHIFLGDTYSTSDKSELAIAEYEEAVKLEGGNPELHMLLAGVYENNKLKDKAVAQYKKASLVAGEDKALHEKLLAKFKELKAWAEVKDEQAEIKRIEKKEKFVEELNEAAPKD